MIPQIMIYVIGVYIGVCGLQVHIGVWRWGLGDRERNKGKNKCGKILTVSETKGYLCVHVLYNILVNFFFRFEI